MQVQGEGMELISRGHPTSSNYTHRPATCGSAFDPDAGTQVPALSLRSPTRPSTNSGRYSEGHRRSGTKLHEVLEREEGAGLTDSTRLEAWGEVPISNPVPKVEPSKNGGPETEEVRQTF